MNEISVVDSHDKPTRGWIWATLFTVMGAVYIYDGVQDLESDMYRLVAGAGFLMVALQAFFSPANFPRLHVPMEEMGAVDWIGMAGVALLCVGLVLRFL